LGFRAFAALMGVAMSDLTNRLDQLVTYGRETDMLNQSDRQLLREAAAALTQTTEQRDHWRREGQRLLELVADTRAERDALQQRYDELILAVARMYPNESRHETALRYIQRAEHITGGCASTAPTGEEPTK
jgi:uncharacterized coiled-coil DUF342 family protein